MSHITKRKYVEQEVMEFVLPSGNQKIVKVVQGRGNNLHAVVDSDGANFLVSMPNKFRKNIWIKRGDFVIMEPIEEGDKVRGEIVHILFQYHIKDIEEAGLWPEAFKRETVKPGKYIEDDLLPPSDSDDSDDDYDLATKVVNANQHNQLYEQYAESEEEESEEEESEEEEEKENKEGESEQNDKSEEGLEKGEVCGANHS